MTMAAVDSDALSDLYRRRGDVSTVYADVSQDTNDPRRTADNRHRAVRDALSEAGAPDGDIRAIEEILEQPPGVASPVSRFLVVRDGEVEVNELLPGDPLAERIISYGALPTVIPLLRHRPRDLGYVVVEVGRIGGEIRQYRLSQVEPVVTRDIAGDSEYITKVQVGGWSQKRFQRDAEEIWKRNQGQLAEAIDGIVRDNRIELVLISGDIRARQLLADQLAPASKELLVEVEANTRADGASSDSLENELHTQLTAILARDGEDALNRLAAESGRDGGLAEEGIGPVVHALQQAQVDTLILDANGIPDKKLLALTAEPWVATAPEETLGAPQLGRVDAAEALARAAILSDARVVLVDEERLPDHVHVAALLRWPTGPAAGAAGGTPA
jgi:hypothetical protein